MATGASRADVDDGAEGWHGVPVAGGNRMQAHSVARGPSARGRASEIRDFFADLAAERAQGGLSPFMERLYGPPDCRDAVLEARRDGYGSAGRSDPGPASYLHGRCDESLDSIAVQVWSVASTVVDPTADRPTQDRHAPRVRLREVRAGGAAGRLLEAPDARWLWLSCVDGRDEQGRLPPDREEQARRMFARAEAALGELGFAYHHVVRTWIALGSILAWYGAFNAVRSSFHARRGIGLPGAVHAPASTGVEGASNGEQCVMDLLAIEPRGPTCAVDRWSASGVQGDACAYGSSFSRAARLRSTAGDLLLVSGTASIGLDGRSLHAGDAEAQARQTLRAIGALLEEAGAGWADVVSATLYGVDRAALGAFERTAAELGLPSLPFAPVVAALCRRELAVEMDAIAALPTGSEMARPTCASSDGGAALGGPTAGAARRT